MRTVIVSAMMLALLMVTPVASAWDSVVGCAVDVYGAPWVWGGTVTCQEQASGKTVGAGTLNTGGCFEVFVSSNSPLLCTINYAPGPKGDPEDGRCAVDADNNDMQLSWNCGIFTTGTGPNAVSLRQVNAAALPAGGVALAIGALLGGAGLWLRRRS